MSAPFVERKRTRDTGHRRWLKPLFAATVPALLAFALERGGLWVGAPWMVFVVAVSVAAWVGGLGSGLAATAISTAIGWWYLVPRAQALGMPGSNAYKATAMFVVIGVGASVFHERLRRAKRETARGRLLFQAVIDHSPGIIEIKDLEGRLLMFNRKLGTGLGLRPDQLVGRTAHDLLPPAAADRRRATDRAVIETGEPMVVEETIDWTDGRHVFLATVFPLRDVDGELFGVCWIETDITRRKRTQEALEQTAFDLKQAQRVAQMGSWWLDLRTQQLIWSEELYRIHGRDPSLPPPRSRDELPALFTPDSAKRLHAAIGGMIRSGTSPELELEAKLPGGSTRWVAVRAEAVRDTSGQVIGARGTTQDISKLKELQRMKEEWISVIAHDLRQPIGVIKMAAQLLPDLHAGAMAEPESATTERIVTAANTLARMVNDLLDVSRIEAHRLSLDRRWMDARTIVEETVKRLSHLTTRVNVVIDCGNVSSRVFVDSGRFEQILGNLVSNAVKYGARDGNIIVRALQRGNDVQLSVTNHGKRIAPEDLPRLFTRFGRAKSAREGRTPGLGLGLYIAKGLVEAHGGRMWVESDPGKTTTFHFTLPSHEAMKAAA